MPDFQDDAKLEFRQNSIIMLTEFCRNPDRIPIGIAEFYGKQSNDLFKNKSFFVKKSFRFSQNDVNNFLKILFYLDKSLYLAAFGRILNKKHCNTDQQISEFRILNYKCSIFYHKFQNSATKFQNPVQIRKFQNCRKEISAFLPKNSKIVFIGPIQEYD